MENFEHLRRARLVLLTVRGSDGLAHNRPVRLSVDAQGIGHIRVLTTGTLARRLDLCPDVRVSPCDLRARPTGSDQPAIARRELESGQSGGTAPSPYLLDLARRQRATFRLTPTNEPTPWLLRG